MKSCTLAAKLFAILMLCATGVGNKVWGQCSTTVNLGHDTTLCTNVYMLDAGNPGATYHWSDGSTARTLAVNANNTTVAYSVTVTVGTCTASDTIKLRVNQLPIVNISFSGPVYVCPDDTVGLYVTGGDHYLWSTGDTTQHIVMRTAGTYAITVTIDSTGCKGSDTTELVIYNPPVVNLGPDVSQCGSTFTLDAGNTGSYYRWSTGIQDSLQTLTVSQSGIYSVTVISVNGCTATDEVNIVIGSPFVVNLGPDVVTCGNSYVLDAGILRASYRWSTGDTARTISVTSSGTYSVTVTGKGGCASADTIQLTLKPLPLVNLGPDTSACAGTITLNAGTGGIAYQWSTGAMTQTISAIAGGKYSVTVTGANGCTAADTIAISIGTVLVDLGHDSTMCADSFLLNAGSAGDMYHWSDGSSKQTLMAHLTGTYSVTVTRAGGCSATDAVNLTINHLPIVNLSFANGPTYICANDSIIVTATGGDQYLWSTGQTSQIVTLRNAGVYAVTVTISATGCTAADSTKLFIYPAPIVNLGPDITQCGGFAILDAGNPSSYYEWSTGDSDRVLTINSSGLYKVTVTSVNGCVTVASMHATIGVPFTVNLGPDINTCGNTYELGATLIQGATYHWSSGQNTRIANVTSSGFYSVTATGIGGCTASDIMHLTLNPMPVVDLGPDSSLCNGTITLNAGNAGSTFLWSNGANTQTATVAASGLYAVTVINSNGCLGSDIVGITIGAASVYLGNDTALCATSYTLDAANPGGTYLWSDNSTSRQLHATHSGTYSVTVTLTGGCSAMDAINITLNALPTVELGANTSICSGFITLDAGNAGSTYLWSNNTSAQTLNTSAPGTYAVTVTSGSGCTASDAITITQGIGPVVNLGNDTSVCAETFVVDAGNVGSTYLWSDGSTNQTLTTRNSGTYSVTVTAPGGCSTADTINLGVHQFNCSLTWTLDTVLVGSGPITLTGGSPLGGTFGGHGVTGNAFDPDSLAPGYYVISYSVTDSATGCSSTAADSLYVRMLDGVENTAVGAVQIFPNPSEGHFVLMIGSSNFKDMTIEIVSMTGKREMIFTHENVAGNYQREFDLSSLAKGIYYLRLVSGTEIVIKAFSVQ